MHAQLSIHDKPEIGAQIRAPEVAPETIVSSEPGAVVLAYYALVLGSAQAQK